MRLAIISDTHLPKGRRELPDRCIELLRSSDLILHAGDVRTTASLDELQALGPPVAGVHGNVDSAEVREQLPAERVVAVDGLEIGMVHDAGPARGRLARMRRRFPAAAAVVFGHSHIPLREADGEFQIFNPGSPTERRRSPAHTMGLAQVGDGRISFELVTLD
ncbi:MAG TPA: metallophosphoesterase family protein [Thermoleophilaceae bacterium]|nr:metallophosphoesterase family protein [Thermoleophilaceae bacterium]